jgi:excinuclease ABC subunit C
MNSQELAEVNLPDRPGVYFFKQGGSVLYIGRATSLRDRVRSYFGSDLIATRGPLLVDMVFQASELSFTITDSVLEAIILEASLIRKHQPKYNTKEKDNKSFNCVVITKEAFPRVLIVRKRDLDQGKNNIVAKYTFGPFPQGSSIVEGLRIIRKIFPFRDKCTPLAGKPCFNAQIGLCPGVCAGSMSAKGYGKIIARIKLFFEGKKAILIRKMEKEMKDYAKKQEFEIAGELKRQIFALTHIQDVALIKNRENLLSETGESQSAQPFRIEAYDIAHLSGKDTVGVMTVLEDGQPAKSQYRKFKIKRGDGAHDIANLREIIERRLTHTEWPYPQMIVTDGNEVQRRAVEEILAETKLSIPVVSVTKDERHKARAIIGDAKLVEKYKRAIVLANSEAHRFAIGYHRVLRGKMFKNSNK